MKRFKGETITVERNGRVIFDKKYEGRKTFTEAVNYVESLGLLVAQYDRCANGRRILLALAEDEI